MQELVIPSPSGKGRSFQATLLAHVVADSLWSGGYAVNEVVRPVWMLLGGSDNELRPFVANLQIGRKADNSAGSKYSRSARYEVLKSAGYQYLWQRTAVGSVVTIFLPDLFRLDLGMVDPKGIQFCLLPAKSWQAPVNPQAALHVANLGADLSLPTVQDALTLAPIFTAFLDRRTRCPLIPDPRFYAQIIVGALTVGLASWSTPLNGSFHRDYLWGEHRDLSFSEYNTAQAGYGRGLVFKATHTEFEEFIAAQVKLYFSRVGS